MIFLVVFRAATRQAVTNAVENAKAASNGYFVLVHGVNAAGTSPTSAMLIQTDAGTSALRNYLSSPLVQVAVLRIHRDWAAAGVQDLAGWLQELDTLF